MPSSLIHTSAAPYIINETQNTTFMFVSVTNTLHQCCKTVQLLTIKCYDFSSFFLPISWIPQLPILRVQLNSSLNFSNTNSFSSCSLFCYLKIYFSDIWKYLILIFNKVSLCISYIIATSLQFLIFLVVYIIRNLLILHFLMGLHKYITVQH